MKQILVVDDSRIMRSIVINSLASKKLPYSFLEASNGKEALSLLENNEIDLIFLDWNMPQLSGLNFLKHVRATKKHENLPIVMVTSEAARYNVIEALKAGVTAYLVKPVSVDKFVKTLKEINFY